MKAGLSYSIALGVIASTATSAMGQNDNKMPVGVVSDFIADMEQSREGRGLPSAATAAWPNLRGKILALSSVNGERDGDEQIEQWLDAFRAECARKGGQTIAPSSAAYTETVRAIFNVYVILEHGDNQGNRRAMELCSDAGGGPMGGVLWARSASPTRTVIIAFGPDAIIGEADAIALREAERLQLVRRIAETQAELDAYRFWQQSASAGEMTGCGRILTARAQVIEIADRRTGQARWVERTELRKPHEGCRW